jgi:hypothetical protein
LERRKILELGVVEEAEEEEEEREEFFASLS